MADHDDVIEGGWCLIDSQTDTVITSKKTKEAIMKEQSRERYGQTITHIDYGYEDEENEGEFVKLPEPEADVSAKRSMKVK